MTDLPVEDRAEEASERIARLTSDLDAFFLAASEVNDFGHLAHYLATLRDLKQLVGQVYDELERAALVAMTDKKVEVPYLGLVERKKSTKRVKWQHDDLFRAVIARLADEPGVFYDPEDGVMLPPAVMASNLVGRLRDVLSPSWKVTGLDDRGLGLQVDEYCEVQEAVDQIVLPPRAAA